ncbi:MarR family winged helix-turn-helix transcriptional regulator [Variovorax terrae]|uniref:MarR family winged helix-turn-helix transcriptional regulator n=1 Tax=Variovorax terrae TaxID=2923278 RepID=A0A9X2ANT7_9BURK|nr:MarR family winged helix-turn-helix transcriptional regulator [Variovorax terrae]MCJ0764734.1 MarR family winged helix-turn-helix transcriptional regulator [Variovorax terrae]
MPTEQLPVDSSLFFKLVRVVNLTARPFHAGVSKQHHLSLNEWRVMVVLASHPGVSATEVADITGLDKMSVSRTLAGLHRHERLQRQDDPADQRRSRLYLSPQGKRLFARIGTQAKVREAELFAGVSAAELERMNVTLDKLIAAVQQSDPA